jgi:hypothetical protein
MLTICNIYNYYEYNRICLIHKYTCEGALLVTINGLILNLNRNNKIIGYLIKL